MEVYIDADVDLDLASDMAVSKVGGPCCGRPYNKSPTIWGKFFQSQWETLRTRNFSWLPYFAIMTKLELFIPW